VVANEHEPHIRRAWAAGQARVGSGMCTHIVHEGFGLLVVVFVPDVFGFEMGVLGFNMGRKEWEKWGWFDSDKIGAVEGVRGGGAPAASAGGGDAAASAATAHLDPSFNGSMASVTTSASVHSSCSSLCLSFCILMDLFQGVGVMSQRGGGTVGGGGIQYSLDVTLFVGCLAWVWGSCIASWSHDSFLLCEAGP
jgi:hypothetical protein